MTTDDPRVIVEEATRQAWEEWSAEHPSLACVIDRLAVIEQVTERLRDRPEYRRAIQNYHRSRHEMTLLNDLLILVRPMLNGVLGL